MTYVGYPFLSLVSLTLTLYLSFLGDDDVVYKFKSRKPTPQEGMVRIRFVVVKMLAALSMGVTVGGIVGRGLLVDIFSMTISHDEAVYFLLADIFLMYLFISWLQNRIRKFQGRKLRPMIDMEIIKINYVQRRD